MKTATLWVRGYPPVPTQTIGDDHFAVRKLTICYDEAEGRWQVSHVMAEGPLVDRAGSPLQGRSATTRWVIWAAEDSNQAPSWVREIVRSSRGESCD